MNNYNPILITNGIIVDGTGKSAYEADILVEDGLIKEIGELEGNIREDWEVINAKELVVCPGFVDLNNHSDTYWTLFEYPNAESLVSQGITTIIGGNCGSSLAPLLTNRAIESIQKYVELSKAQVNWNTFGEFVSFLKGQGVTNNFGSLVGHLTLRRAITGDEMRSLTGEELKILVDVLKKSLEEGALGLSSGLSYTHSRSVEKQELLALVKAVKEKDGLYSTHLRGEGALFLQSIKEALEIAKETGVRLEISHFKVKGRPNWFLQEQALELIKEAREEGFDVNYDVYPYLEAGPVLYTLLPSWVTEKGRENLIKMLRNKKIKEKVIKEMQKSAFDYGSVFIAKTGLNYPLSHRKVALIAENQGRSPEEVIVDLAVSSHDLTIVIVEEMSQTNLEKALLSEFSIISSNGASYSRFHRHRGELVHPRSFGAMPRFLSRYALKEEFLPIEMAVAKITGIPAKKIGILNQLGTLEKRKKADIVVFDPKRLCDQATITNPFRYSKGILEVMIGGARVVKEGRILKGIRNGEVLTRKE